MKKILYLIIGFSIVYFGLSFFKNRASAKKTVYKDTIKYSVENGKEPEQTNEPTSTVIEEAPVPLSTSSAKFEPTIDIVKSTITPRTDPAAKVIKAKITGEDGLVPSEFTVKVGQKVRMEIMPEVDVEGCMNTIMIEGNLYSDPIEIFKGKKIVMEFTPKKVGSFYITCAMGSEWGIIHVIK